MKQKVLLLMVLALGMCSAVTFAQTKEYEVADDGFEWYKVSKVVNGKKKYGAEDLYGSMIVPVEYDFVYYYKSDIIKADGGFRTKKGNYRAWYNKSGKCIVPYTRGYTDIYPAFDKRFGGTYYGFSKPNGGGLLDKNGKEVLFIKAGVELTWVGITERDRNNKTYYFCQIQYKKNGEVYWGAVDTYGKIIVKQDKDRKHAFELALSQVTTTWNPLAETGKRHWAETEGHPQGGQNNPVEGQHQNQQTGGTRTIVVEHHRDPVPVQEWVQCHICYGSGRCTIINCNNGWNPNTRMECLGCRGSGRCSACAGRGGTYMTVYR